MLIDFIEVVGGIRDGIMSRSFNSRKGHYSCKACKGWDFESKALYSRTKKSRKRDAIKFDGTIYTYKKHSKTKKDTFFMRRYREEDWYYKAYILPAFESYLNWTWLKGKPNKKGQRAPTGHW